MKYLFVWLLFFSFCSSKKAERFTVVRVYLSSNLPFQQVKLKKFDPAYGNLREVDHTSTLKNGFTEFRLPLSEPSVFYMTDKNSIGVGELFLHPDDTLGIRLSWKGQNIHREIVSGSYPGDNLLVAVLPDTLDKVAAAQLMAEKEFSNEIQADGFVDKLFNRIVLPILSNKAEFGTSPEFAERVLPSRLALLKRAYQNEYRERSHLAPVDARRHPLPVFYRPHYQYWNRGSVEYYGFRQHLYEVVNGSSADNFLTYMNNIDSTYRDDDPELLRIAMSQGLFTFLEHVPVTYASLQVNRAVDSICQKFDLERGKYNYPETTISSSEMLAENVLEQILIYPVVGTAPLPLAQLFRDTSKLYYIDYWASWCKPCIEGIPATISFAKANADQVEVFFISADSKRENFSMAARKFALPPPKSFAVVFDEHNVAAYRKLNPLEQLPAYQILFFHQGVWRTMAAYSAKEKMLRLQLEDVLRYKGMSAKPFN